MRDRESSRILGCLAKRHSCGFDPNKFLTKQVPSVVLSHISSAWEDICAEVVLQALWTKIFKACKAKINPWFLFQELEVNVVNTNWIEILSNLLALWLLNSEAVEILYCLQKHPLQRLFQRAAVLVCSWKSWFKSWHTLDPNKILGVKVPWCSNAYIPKILFVPKQLVDLNLAVPSTVCL